MSSRRRWLPLLIVAMLAVMVLAAMALVPDEASLRRRLSAAVEQRYGVPVDIGGVSWVLLPVPAFTVRAIHTHQRESIDIGTLEVRLALWPHLLKGEIGIASLTVTDARVPTAALRAFRRSEQQQATPPRVGLQQVRLRRLTWVSRTGVELPLHGDIDLDADWRPSRAVIWRPGFVPVTRLVLARAGRADRWLARVDLGGGSANGTIALSIKGEWLALTGRLAPAHIDLVTAAAGLNRRTAVGGRAHGVTQVGARGKTPGELGSSLRLRTTFEVDDSELLRLDLDRAIRTLGANHEGRTRLKSLTGVMDLQNTGVGTVISYRQVVARGESFAATGQCTVFNRQVAASGRLQTLSGGLALPFQLTGSTRDVHVTVPAGVKAGAIVGTVLLPGIGTVLGAKLAADMAGEASPPPMPPGTPRIVATPLEPN